MSLPPLPEPALPHSRLVTKSGVFGALYTEAQLIAYGRQCVEASADRVWDSRTMGDGACCRNVLLKAIGAIRNMLKGEE
jgi:hypothetical protein